MAFRMTSSQEVTIGEVKGLDKRGNPAPVEGATVTSSDESVLVIEDRDDGAGNVSKVAKAVGKLGTAQIQLQADAIVGEAEKIITGTVDVEIIAGEAAVLEVSLGEPTEQV